MVSSHFVAAAAGAAAVERLQHGSEHEGGERVVPEPHQILHQKRVRAPLAHALA